MDVSMFLGFLSICAVVGLVIGAKMRPGIEQRRLEREAKADLIAEMKWTAAQKRAAADILRKNGETP